MPPKPLTPADLVAALQAKKEELRAKGELPDLRHINPFSLLKYDGEAIRGDDNDNYLVGTDRKDVLTGMSGNDVLVGGDGNDYFVTSPGMGNDTLTGGAGADIFEIPYEGVITITDFNPDEGDTFYSFGDAPGESREIPPLPGSVRTSPGYVVQQVGNDVTISSAISDHNLSKKAYIQGVTYEPELILHAVVENAQAEQVQSHIVNFLTDFAFMRHLVS